MEVENTQNNDIQTAPTEESPKSTSAADHEIATASVTTVNGNEAEASTRVPNSKDAQKPSPKKPKKRKPKTPRDVTAPRQPLTGENKIYSLMQIT